MDTKGSALMTMPSEALDDLFAGLPETLTVTDVARIFRKSRPWVYDKLTSGIVPGYQAAGNWLILRDELKQYLLDGSNANR